MTPRKSKHLYTKSSCEEAIKAYIDYCVLTGDGVSKNNPNRFTVQGYDRWHKRNPETPSSFTISKHCVTVAMAITKIRCDIKGPAALPLSDGQQPLMKKANAPPQNEPPYG